MTVWSLLIANRGEIAVRIAATARRMGIATVAVFTGPDRGAMHAAACDRAVFLGEDPGLYLSVPALLAAARQGGAQAVHPGYGFLSENADFAAAVQAVGLTWVGSSPAAIRAMGRKDAAKAAMAAAGVPVVPGVAGIDDPRALAEAAAGLGWPVAIKAVAGGGGRGLRRVEGPADFPAALAEAQGEALSAFGDGRVLLERWIDRPRHIEVQVLGDGARAIHLFERDCSLQRRHQKVIEEAPAPGMTAEVRAAMGAAAVRAAEAIGYAGAGTVEFIADAASGLRPDGFWFMEMNTRLQVEHPVTEAVTGLDLVEWQLRIAGGEPLSLRQEDVALRGHAVEARLYAEDPAAGFLPQAGRIAHLAFPPELRADTGVRAGDTVSPHYDPMLAKLIAHGPTRAAAFAALAQGLDAVELAGPATNLGFLARLCRHPAVVAGELDTGLIARDLPALLPPPPDPATQALALLATADVETGPMAGFALWRPLWHPAEAEAGPHRIAGEIAVDAPDAARVRVAGQEIAAHLTAAGWQTGSPARRLDAGGGAWLLTPGQGALPLRRPDPLARDSAKAAAGDTVTAPMAGLLRRLDVAPGQTVTAGQPLAVVEAMKMQHTLTAPRAGRIAAVPLAQGAQVAAGALIVALEP